MLTLALLQVTAKNTSSPSSQWQPFKYLKIVIKSSLNLLFSRLNRLTTAIFLVQHSFAKPFIMFALLWLLSNLSTCWSMMVTGPNVLLVATWPAQSTDVLRFPTSWKLFIVNAINLPVWKLSFCLKLDRFQQQYVYNLPDISVIVFSSYSTSKGKIISWKFVKFN